MTDGPSVVPAVAIVGAGSIGAAWAIVFARSGSAVHLTDSDAGARAAALGRIERRLQELRRNDLLDERPAAVLSRITVVASAAEAVAGAGWVQECVVEDVEVKRALFAELDALADPEAVLASSTSMIACSRWADGLAGRARCVVVHPGNPPYLLPVAEIVPAPFTSDDTVERARIVLAAAGMTPVVVHGEPEGFVFNRLQGALLREAYCLVRDGVASAADIDRVVADGLGRRWAVIGPFATAQLNTRGGIRRHAQVMGPAYARMGADRGQHDPWTDDLVAAVADDLADRLPDAGWEEQVVRRDEALIQLERARRGAAGLFGSFDESASRTPAP
jgi:3-hydroxyacyl-CoA dehydrogenase